MAVDLESRPVAPEREGVRRPRRRRRLPYVLATPAVVLVAVALLYPIGYGLYLSFFDWRLSTGLPPRFTGLDQYEEILFGAEGFLNSLRTTAVFAGLSLVIEVGCGLVIALMLNRAFPGRKYARMLVLLPLMIPAVVVGLGSRIIYDHELGILAYTIRLFGIEPPVFLGEPGTALVIVAITEAWRSTPFVALVILAALQAVPSDLKEAAQVDGAGGWATFRHVVLPLIMPIVLIALLFRTVDLMRTFELIYLMTRGGPGNSTEVIGMWIYRTGFESFNIGLSSAGSVVLFVLTLGVTVWYLRAIIRRQRLV